jgi:hypothetical protein
MDPFIKPRYIGTVKPLTQMLILIIIHPDSSDTKVIYKVLSVIMSHSINAYLNGGMAPRVLNNGIISRSKAENYPFNCRRSQHQNDSRGLDEDKKISDPTRKRT